MVEVHQYIEAVGLLQKLLVSLHAAHGLAVFKDLDGLQLVALQGLRLELIDLEVDLKEEKLCIRKLLGFTVITLALIFEVDLARGELDKLVLHDARELTGCHQSTAVLLGKAKELQAGLEQLADESLLLLEVQDHTEVQVHQSRYAILRAQEIKSTFFHEILCHKPKEVRIQACHSSLFDLEVIGDFSYLCNAQVLHGLDSCLEDILEQEGLGELLEVVGLAAESKDISQLLLDLLVALLLAYLQQLNDRGIELHLHELGEVGPITRGLQESWQHLTLLGNVDDGKEAILPLLNEHLLHSLGILELKLTCIKVCHDRVEQLGHLLIVLLALGIIIDRCCGWQLGDKLLRYDILELLPPYLVLLICIKDFNSLFILSFLARICSLSRGVKQ